MRRLLLFVIVALPLALAPTAAADAPTKVEESFHRSAPNFASCPGFTVRGEFDVTRTVTTFYDLDGTPIRQVLHDPLSPYDRRGTGDEIECHDLAALVGERHPGHRVAQRADEVDDTEPGLGVVFADVGRVVRAAVGPGIFFAAGQHDLIEGDVEDLCGYLAG